jgi:hypothetical protein
VGDAKFRRINAAGVKHADDYQLLAYATAQGVVSGMLVYAAGEATGFEPAFRVAGMRRLIRTLDIDGTPATLLQRITDLGDASPSVGYLPCQEPCPPHDPQDQTGLALPQ